MTAPVTTEALRTALVRACFDPGHVIGPRGDRTTDEWRGDACMKQIASLLAALQQVTAERDAEKARADRIDAKLGELNAAVRECLPPVDALIAEREAAEAALATATAEAARLRAEVEAKDRAIRLLLPFVDYAAGDGLVFLGADDTGRPEMDAQDICYAVAETLGMELGDPEFLALVDEGHGAIAARAATARKG